MATRPEPERALDFFAVDLAFVLPALAPPRFAVFFKPRLADAFLVLFPDPPPDDRLAVELFFPFADRVADFLAIPESFL
jgi:hypothetical protein